MYLLVIILIGLSIGGMIFTSYPPNDILRTFITLILFVIGCLLSDLRAYYKGIDDYKKIIIRNTTEIINKREGLKRNERRSTKSN
jgi:uncharacterized membrane protein